MKLRSVFRIKRWLFLSLPLLSMANLYAHPLDFGLINFQQEKDIIRVKLEMNPKAVADLIGLKNRELSTEEFSNFKDVWVTKTLEKMLVSRGGALCSWVSSVALDFHLPQSVGLSGNLTCPQNDGIFILKTQFWKELPKTYQFLVLLDFAGSENLKSLDASTPEMRVEFNKELPSFLSFVRLGMEHIGATLDQWWTGDELKTPEGVDHILFVLALLLGGAELWSIAKMVTGFTLGHSLTLMLATYQIVQIPSRWVESAIALSITYVSAQTLIFKKRESHWRLAVCFGLIHGLGFATALSPWRFQAAELFRVLVGFNLGVEIGQGIIILFVFPILWTIRKYGFLEKITTTISSSSIFVLGTYWFLRRAFNI